MSDPPSSGAFIYLLPKVNAYSLFTGCVAIYLLGLAIYRLYLTPSAKFPGPRLAVLSYWYEFYYDVWPHEGQYTWKIRDLHERYGMETSLWHHVWLNFLLSKIRSQLLL
jgi:hypothetical protein